MARAKSTITEASRYGSGRPVNCYSCIKEGKEIQSKWCVSSLVLDKSGRQIGISRKYYCDKHMKQVNPIQSPEQYGLMQAVASGMARVKGVSKQVAKKLIHETPKGLRREFASVEADKRSNPLFSKRYVVSADKKSKFDVTVLSYTDMQTEVRRSANLYRQPYFLVDETGKVLYKANPRKQQNPEDISAAEDLTTKFHGRPPKETIEITESESYDSDLAMLGELTELEILSEDSEDVIPISFSRDTPEDCIRLCSTPNGRQLEFVGGDQSLDLEEFEEAGLQLETGKRQVVIGPIHSISYYTDKHHLAGSSNQKTGVEFIHEFSEESNGALPMLVYDTKDEKMEIVGGRYKVEEEGIKD